MTRPDVHPVAEQAYRLLPDYVRSADPAADWTALRLMAAMTAGMQRALDLLTIADPDTSASGTSELANPDRVPREWLGWLGLLLGIDITRLPVELARDVVSDATASRMRGSRAAIAAAVARTLSDAVPAPRVWANFSGTDPYRISIVTNIAQTPDPVATLQAALAEKPAGMVLELQTVEAATWAEVETQYATWADVESAFATWADVEEWIPST